MNARRLLLAITAAAIPAVQAGAQTVVVTSPPVITYSGAPRYSDPIVADTWVRENVGGAGATASVGVSATYPRSGTGSAFMQFSQDVGTSAGKADMEYYFSSPFTLGSLSGMSYDWYRDASSTVAAHLVPSLRLVLASPTTGYLGYLIYEPIYNELAPASPAPLDAWQTSTIGGTSNFWFSKNGGGPYTSLASWQAGTADARINANTLVIGLSSGIGSGWNAGQSYTGAVDNISYTQGGNPAQTFNFEAVTATPEPASVALMATGLLALGGAAARRRRNA